MLDTPIGTVKGRMRLGLEKMRGQLGGLAEAMHEPPAPTATTRGAYVLGALPDDEHAALRGAPARAATSAGARSPTCRSRPTRCRWPRCRSSRRRSCSDRIMSVVRSEAELLRAAGRAPTSPTRRRAAQAPRRTAALAAAPCARCRPRWPPALLVAAGVIGGVVLPGGDDTQHRHRHGQIASAPAARASLQLSDDATARRCAGMPPPPSGKVYQVWLKRAEPGPGADDGAVPHRPGRQRRRRDPAGRLKGVDQVLVTAEPDGGSMEPTSAPVIVASRGLTGALRAG